MTKLCECNCGEYTKLGNRFIHGHSRRGAKHTEETKKKFVGMQNAKGSIRTEKFKEGSRQNMLKLWEEGKLRGGWFHGESYPESVFRKFLEAMDALTQ